MGKQTGCYADSIAANPNRPTVSNTAHVTQYGVLELEDGWDRIWPEKSVRQTSSTALLKFGMLCDIDLRWTTTSFVSQVDPSGTSRTVGDNWFGAQMRFHKQVSVLPSMAIGYSLKVPTADVGSGIGSGYVDHSFTFGVSENVENFTFDLNVVQQLAGRRGGFDRNQLFALAGSHPIWQRLQWAVELYGTTQLNSATPAFASSLGALTYSINPRLVLDGGYEAGITSGGPHRHVFFGATYSIANLYGVLRRTAERGSVMRVHTVKH